RSPRPCPPGGRGCGGCAAIRAGGPARGPGRSRRPAACAAGADRTARPVRRARRRPAVSTRPSSRRSCGRPQRSCGGRNGQPSSPQRALSPRLVSDGGRGATAPAPTCQMYVRTGSGVAAAVATAQIALELGGYGVAAGLRQIRRVLALLQLPDVLGHLAVLRGQLVDAVLP